MHHPATNPASSALILSLSIGNFAIGMGAFVVLGILSPLAQDLGMTTAQSGFVMTVYALAYVVCSPVLLSLTGSIDRRVLLIGSSCVIIASALAAAISTSEIQLYVCRIFAAAGAGLFSPIAAGVAFSTSRPDRRAAALSKVFLGLSLAQALGMPVGGLVGYTLGWRSLFYLVAALSAVALWLVIRHMPRHIPFQVNSLGTLLGALKDWRSVLSIFFAGSFSFSIYVTYTFISPILEGPMGFGRNGVSMMLLVYGLGAVIGSWLSGWLADRFGAARTLAFMCVAQIVTSPLLSYLPIPVPAFAVLTLAWSTIGWSVMVPQQSRLLQQMPDRQAVALGLNQAAIYLGAALGAAAGAVVIDRVGLSALGWASSIVMIAALGHLFISERNPPRR